MASPLQPKRGHAPRRRKILARISHHASWQGHAVWEGQRLGWQMAPAYDAQLYMCLVVGCIADKFWNLIREDAILESPICLFHR